MKNTIHSTKVFILGIILVFGLSAINTLKAGVLYSLSHDCGSGELIVNVISDQNYAGTSTWNPCGFTISWLMTEGSSLTGNPGLLNGFNYDPQNNGNDGTYYYQVFSHTSINQIGLTSGVPIEVARIPLSGGVNLVDFNIPASNNAWIIANSGTSYFSNEIGNQYPTTYSIVSDLNVPLVAGVIWDGVTWCGGTGTDNQPGASDGSKNCYVLGAGGVLTTNGALISQLNIEAGADLTINPLATLTAGGATHIEGTSGLIIAASASGTGSFIDNGTITYGTNGSANVQQYFVDNVTNVPFHNHFVGPMVTDPAFETANGGTKGVFLQAFDLASSSSYAYEFLSSSNTWNNISSLTYPIPTTKGITLSTTNNQNYTISQVGKLITGAITTANGGTITGAGNNLLSNPFPSGINLLNFSLVNAVFGGSIGTTIRVWEGLDQQANGGNYSTYTMGVGTGGLVAGVLRVGQGFFVESIAGAPVAFASNPTYPERTHATGILLKDALSDLLRIKVKGNNFSDELIVRFSEGATNQFDQYDAEKWPSMYEDATEAWTVANDNSLLTINTMEPLGTEMVSVPLSFKCGAESSYTIEASNIESFEVGSEIYLEDLKIGGEWYDLVQNPVYEFSGSLNDIQERFILHFFGSTGIEDNPQADVKAIQIYSWGHDAYIVNRGNETVKEYIAYDMMGRELQRGTLPNSTVNKVSIGNVSAYYIVKVITKEGHVYNGKVYITK